MTLTSSVRGPRLLLITHSMILSVILNMPRRFCPDALCHFCLLYAYWSDAIGLSAWENLDILQPDQMRHNLVKDLHVFGSYVTGHLSHEHPHVPDISALCNADGHEDGDVPIDVVTTRSQVVSKLRTSGELPASSATSNSGEKVQELSVSNRVDNMIDDILGDEQQVASSKPMFQDYKKFKHGKEVP
jgi:hypothetical protein